MEELGRRSSLSQHVVFLVSPSATSLVAFSPSSFPVPRSLPRWCSPSPSAASPSSPSSSSATSSLPTDTSSRWSSTRTPSSSFLSLPLESPMGFSAGKTIQCFSAYSQCRHDYEAIKNQYFFSISMVGALSSLGKTERQAGTNLMVSISFSILTMTMKMAQ